VDGAPMQWKTGALNLRENLKNQQLQIAATLIVTNP
jgi:hypothetical protein